MVFFNEDPRRGLSPGWSGGGGGEGQGGCLRGIWGVGAKFFFQARNSHQVLGTQITLQKLLLNTSKAFHMHCTTDFLNELRNEIQNAWYECHT